MYRPSLCFACFTCLIAFPLPSWSQDQEPVVQPKIEVPQQLAGLSTEQFAELVQKTRQSVVLVDIAGRDGKTLGLGSGFVVGPGLIATNLHVIGEARPISVKLLDGKRVDVLEVLATDKTQDLAILKVDADNLVPLEIASNDLLHGQPVFALGNPEGLEQSVVTGVVSGFKNEEGGMSLIQLAIPIERGNSGGPLCDMQGRVHGLLTLKSQVTLNLGYAVKASALQTLLDAPNPIPMSRWLTIGTLSPRLWEPSMDVPWRQRAGRIHVEGTGTGFGGRSLCFSKLPIPAVPYEIAVDVKIQETDGAGGLIFHADGGDLHYGFYPSSGGLRLSRFDGPSVYSWNVLEDTKSKHFKSGAWNRLKIRIEENRFLCYCNEELIFESTDDRLKSGTAGLAKFRHSTVDFKRFDIAKEIPSDRPDATTLARINELAATLPANVPVTQDLIHELDNFNEAGRLSLEAEANNLEERAKRLRQLARELHEDRIRNRLHDLVSNEQNESFDLLHAALLLAGLDNPELDTNVYLNIVEEMATEFKSQAPDDESEEELITRFHKYLFQDQGYHGSRTNYYHASNSYINEAIDDREGLPITLSVLYIDLARRVGFSADGVGLPGHFIARLNLDENKTRLIDPFERGATLTEKECRQLVRDFKGLPWDETFLETQTSSQILVRILRNLIGVANASNDLEAALRYVKTILILEPESAQDRLYKAVLCYHTQRVDEGLSEVDWILLEQPEEIEMARVTQLQTVLKELKVQER